MCVMASPGGQYRVKVYELSAEYQWEDKGCGYLQCERDPDTPDDDHAVPVRFVVQSESDSSTSLLVCEVREDTEYKRQQDTLILWTEPDGRDLALSFQEKANCDEVWARLQLFQSKPPLDALSDTATTDAEDNGSAPPLPPVTAANLHEIADTFLHAPFSAKERLATAVVEQDYVSQLLALFHSCEAEGNTEDLGLLFQAFKGIFLLNESSVFEVLLQPAIIMDVIGTLEYDPELTQPVRHRAFLTENSVFREVVPFNDEEIVDKIKLTQQVQYIKDVILARVLEDTTVQILNSFIFFNLNDIVRHVSGDNRFLDELFSRVRDANTSDGERCDLVMFVRECVTLKTVQHAVRASCLRALCARGLFDIFPHALTAPNARIRLAATEILGALLSFDPHMVRTHIKAEYQTMKRSEAGAVRTRLAEQLLIKLIVDGLVSNDDAGLNGQMCEILRTLLDTDTMDGYTMAEKSMFLGMFYDECFDTLVSPLLALPEDGGLFRRQARERRGVMYVVLDLLTSFVTRHANRARNKLLRDGALLKAARLVELAPTYVALAALRFFKSIVALKDEFYIRHIVEESAIFACIARAFAANGDRYNMLNSAIVDLCEQIHKAKLQRLLDHMVECHWAAFRSAHYVPTFKEILSDYKLAHPDTTLEWVVGDTEHMDVKREATPDLLDVSEDDMEGDGAVHAGDEHTEDALKKRKLQ